MQFSVNEEWRNIKQRKKHDFGGTHLVLLHIESGTR